MTDPELVALRELLRAAYPHPGEKHIIDSVLANEASATIHIFRRILAHQRAQVAAAVAADLEARAIRCDEVSSNIRTELDRYRSQWPPDHNLMCDARAVAFSHAAEDIRANIPREASSALSTLLAEAREAGRVAGWNQHQTAYGDAAAEAKRSRLEALAAARNAGIEEALQALAVIKAKDAGTKMGLGMAESAVRALKTGGGE